MGRVQLSQGCRATTKRKFTYNQKSPGILRGSHQRFSVRKGVLRNFAKLTGKHLCQSPFFNKVAGLSSTTLLKKRLWHRSFHMNFVKFLRAPLLQNTPGRLLLNTSHSYGLPWKDETLC